MQIFSDKLENLINSNTFRTLKDCAPINSTRINANGKQLVNFSSNNYLGLAQHSELIQAANLATEKYGVGAVASRLITGTTPLHTELEQKLAEFKHTEAAIVFPTGYMANLGTISVIVGKGDAILCDRFNHASIFDGARLSGAKLLVFPHRDTEALKRILDKQRGKFNRNLIITDSLFSMDGDIAPLPEIVQIAKHYNCLTMVDEAHATGIFGRNGGGLIEHFGLTGQIDVTMGTLSKALGSLGGFVAGSKELIDFLVNKSKSFIYTTALPAANCAAGLKAIEIVQNEPQRRARLWKNIELLRKHTTTNSQILPIHIGEAKAALLASERLIEAGFLVHAIRPPTVPKGTARLRISLSSEHNQSDIERLRVELSK